jgi:uncharacterized membrane protein YdjX (TVP38/TMEM64 family)
MRATLGRRRAIVNRRARPWYVGAASLEDDLDRPRRFPVRAVCALLLVAAAVALLALLPVRLRYDEGVFVEGVAGGGEVRLFSREAGTPRAVWRPAQSPAPLRGARHVDLPGGIRIPVIDAAPPGAPPGQPLLLGGPKGLPPGSLERGRLLHERGAHALDLSLAGALLEPGGIRALADRFRRAVDARGVWGRGLYVLAYALVAVIAFPTTVLTLAAALSFDFWEAFLLVYAGVNVGALSAFLTGRYLARGWVLRHLPARLRALDAHLAERGFRTVLVLRLLTIAPFLVVNYTCAVSAIRLRDFALGTVAGVLPITLLWVYTLGELGRLSPADPWFWARFLLLAPLLVTYLVTRRHRRARA